MIALQNEHYGKRALRLALVQRLVQHRVPAARRLLLTDEWQARDCEWVGCLSSEQHDENTVA